jgi:peptide-methionine (R)-S-oxide reductase
MGKNTMTRRTFIAAMAGIAVSLLWGRKGIGGSQPVNSKIEKIEKIHKTEAQWKAILTPKQFHILRKEGTERPYTSPLLDNKKAGLYVCAGCELPLFTSDMKYDSGTGWPSFYTSLPGRLETKADFKLIWPRTEYHCARCGGHQGHIFKDGPPPTHERWCNNGLALNFVEKS